MTIKQHIQSKISEIVSKLYGIENVTLEVQKNKTEFEGDFTIVIFPLVKLAKKSPDVLGNELGEEIKNQIEFIENFGIVKGFLNLKVKDSAFLQEFSETEQNFDSTPSKNETVMVEYSSPNTNKPLHLGHIRNNLLGFSVAEILKADGYNVIKSQIINDRGIHICKSMLAWEKFGNGATPESTGLKGDKLVGNYYVLFEKTFQKEFDNWIETEQGNKEFEIFKTKSIAEKIEISEKDEDVEFEDVETNNDDEWFNLKKDFKKHFKNQYFKNYSIVGNEAQEMLLKWEQNDADVRKLWEMMNSWVYAGFNQTYSRLGVNFDQVQYESNTYILGKDLIQKGLEDGILYKKDDGSVWCDLTDEGLDQKLLLRSDGTSVYMTQDLGTAVERFKKNDIQKLIYTVGNEQDYHFQVLFKILKKLGYEWADQLFHLSYGMVELPEGKMKSREGTVVDADDLVEEMYKTAKEKSQELGKLETLSDEDKEKSYETVGLGALKYFILKVDPKKKMLFNPAESIDFNGNTGPFIQYTYARIQSLLDKAGFETKELTDSYLPNDSEKDLIMLLSEFKDVVNKAAASLSPALVANYVYELVKGYNSFYQNNPILNQDNETAKQFRLQLSELAGRTIKKGLSLLGIGTVNRM